MASRVLEVPIGAGQVVQIVDGAQPGLLLCWQDPGSSDFSSAGAIEADRPDVAIPAAVDSVWLVWPAVLLSSSSVTLRTWSSSPAFVPPAWERSGREEVELLAQSFEAQVAGSNNGKVLYTSEDVERNVGDLELRRFSTVIAYVHVRIAGTIAENEIDVTLEIQHGSTWIEYYSSPATRNQVWQDTTPSSANVARMAIVAFPIPMETWRIRLNNSDLLAAVGSWHVYQSTAAFLRFTI